MYRGRARAPGLCPVNGSLSPSPAKKKIEKKHRGRPRKVWPVTNLLAAFNLHAHKKGLMEFAGVDKTARSKNGGVENAGVD